MAGLKDLKIPPGERDRKPTPEQLEQFEQLSGEIGKLFALVKLIKGAQPSPELKASIAAIKDAKPINSKPFFDVFGPFGIFAALAIAQVLDEDRPELDKALVRYATARRGGDLDAASMAAVAVVSLVKDRNALREIADEAVKEERKLVAKTKTDAMRKAIAEKSKFVEGSIMRHATERMRGTTKPITAEALAGKIIAKVNADLESAGINKTVGIDAIASRIRKNGGPTAYKP
jgi:hypothetical protein